MRELTIHRYMADAQGHHAHGISGIEGASVLVRGERAAEVAAELAASAEALTAARREADARATALRARLEELSVELAKARAAIPPARPAELLGTACIREAPGEGRGLWVLGNAAKGWASFGFWVAGWDDLFRRFDVVIGAPITDQHGQYWPAEPRK